jgi:hypothetical protein
MFRRDSTIAAIAFIASTNGCVSQIVPFDEAAKSWVGRPVADYEAMGRRSGTYQSRAGLQPRWVALGNGKREFISPVRRGCDIAFEVNDAGTILSYRPIGDRCFSRG